MLPREPGINAFQLALTAKKIAKIKYYVFHRGFSEKRSS